MAGRDSAAGAGSSRDISWAGLVVDWPLGETQLEQLIPRVSCGLSTRLGFLPVWRLLTRRLVAPTPSGPESKGRHCSAFLNEPQKSCIVTFAHSVGYRQVSSLLGVEGRGHRPCLLMEGWQGHVEGTQGQWKALWLPSLENGICHPSGDTLPLGFPNSREGTRLPTEHHGSTAGDVAHGQVPLAGCESSLPSNQPSQEPSQEQPG